MIVGGNQSHVLKFAWMPFRFFRIVFFILDDVAWMCASLVCYIAKFIMLTKLSPNISMQLKLSLVMRLLLSS